MTHPGDGSTSARTSTGLPANVAGALAYITGVLFYVLERDNRFVRFHAAQSIVVSIVMIVISIVLGILGAVLGFIPFIGWIWYLVECGCLPGTPGPNRFGPDPLGGPVTAGSTGDPRPGPDCGRVTTPPRRDRPGRLDHAEAVCGTIVTRGAARGAHRGVDSGAPSRSAGSV